MNVSQLHDLGEAIKYEQSMCAMERELDSVQLFLICAQWKILVDKEKEVFIRLNALNWFFGASYFVPVVVKNEINFLLEILLDGGNNALLD